MILDTLKSLRGLQLREELMQRIVTPEVEDLLARAPKPVGSFGYDPWGYNENAARIALGVFKLLYEKYFRVTAHGLENVPRQGRVLIVPNHSGQLPFDGVLIGTAMVLNHDGPRIARAMIERFFPTVPWLGNLLNGMGGVIGDPSNCAKMLDNEEAVIVFPEGVRGSGKLYRDRYQLQRFGNGFMHLAMNHRTPIIPVGVVGCEETMPALANLAPIAKLLGLPYLPLVPAPFPLPARVYLNFGEPMVFEGDVENEDQIGERVEQVKSAIRGLVDKGLAERTKIY